MFGRHDHEGGEGGHGHHREHSYSDAPHGLKLPYRLRQELLLPGRYPLDSDNGFANADVMREREMERMAAYGEVHSPANVGRFVRPQKNDWASHKAVIAAGELRFDPKYYDFDRIVAERAHMPMIFDKENRHYAENATARLNVAVLRNYLLNHLFPDGIVDNNGAKDQHNVTHMFQIAIETGKILNRGSGLLPSLLPSVTPAQLKVEGGGAGQLYRKLLAFQHRETWFKPILLPYRIIARHNDFDWRLAPLEETPFHPRNLTAPSGHAPSSPHDGYSPHAVPMHGPDLTAQGFHALGDTLGAASIPYAHVDELSQPVKHRAIELAREILEKMRLRFGDVPVAQMMDRVDAPAALDLFAQINQFSTVFRDHFSRASDLDPNILHDYDVMAALDSMGILAHQAQLYALRAAETNGDAAGATALAQGMQQMPPTWQHAGALTLGDLFAGMNRGMDKLMQRLQAAQQSADGADTLARVGHAASLAELAHGHDPSHGTHAPSLQRQSQASAMHNQQQISQRTQHLMATDQLFDRQPKPMTSAQANAAGAPAPSGRPSRSGKTGMRPSKPPKDLLAANTAGTASLTTLLSADQMARMRSSVSAPTVGEAVNPGMRPKAPKMAKPADPVVEAPRTPRDELPYEPGPNGRTPRSR